MHAEILGNRCRKSSSDRTSVLLTSSNACNLSLSSCNLPPRLESASSSFLCLLISTSIGYRGTSLEYRSHRDPARNERGSSLDCELLSYKKCGRAGEAGRSRGR